MWSVFTKRSSAVGQVEQKFSFSDLIQLQEQVLLTVKPKNESALILAEVSPTVTLGARQVHDENQVAMIQKLREQLEKAGVDLLDGERGGKETWHGPGQWVGFVLTPLLSFTGDSKGIRKAVYLILETVLEVVRKYESNAKIEEGDRLGIWSSTGKLVSVGIKVRQGYTSSGFAVNCIPHPLSFYGINPCGLGGAIPDFLFKNRVPEKDWAAEFDRLALDLAAAFKKK